MADYVLRGMQIGAKSVKPEDGVILTGRYIVHCKCPNGREFEILLSTEATSPANWECRHGVKGEFVDEAPEDKETRPVKPARTHWDMLCERRSLEELKVVLNGQLTLFREG